MKSGPVNTDENYKYYEPESWRFGESPYGPAYATNYMRHASGQIYGLSAPIAKYLSRSSDILHRFANEDVTVGAWLVGLEIQHVHDNRFCCQGHSACQGQVSPVCPAMVFLRIDTIFVELFGMLVLILWPTTTKAVPLIKLQCCFDKAAVNLPCSITGGNKRDCAMQQACPIDKMCNTQTDASNICLSYYETYCAGICNATTRLESIYWMCIADPLKTGANAWWKLNQQLEPVVSAKIDMSPERPA